jgi:hypothetical protein
MWEQTETASGGKQTARNQTNTPAQRQKLLTIFLNPASRCQMQCWRLDKIDVAIYRVRRGAGGESGPTNAPEHEADGEGTEAGASEHYGWTGKAQHCGGF